MSNPTTGEIIRHRIFIFLATPAHLYLMVIGFLFGIGVKWSPIQDEEKKE